MNYLPTPSGSFRLFRVAGITVFLHWSWLLILVLEYQMRGEFQSPIWNVIEYVTLFVIVLLHEFGHALACRSVGGKANQIVLWPLGGVAYVQPPPRPGAFLWSIAAGPLVNVLLIPVTYLLWQLSPATETTMVNGILVEGIPDITRYTRALFYINGMLLIFNVLPIYPLDGGQILQSLLWYVMGRGRSIVVASAIGIAGGVAIAGFGLLLTGQWWLGLVGVFVLLQAWSGLQYGLELSRRERLPRHQQVACPSCGQTPMQGPHWQCGHCGLQMDPFAEGGMCPRCGSQFGQLPCTECQKLHPVAAWYEVKQAQ